MSSVKIILRTKPNKDGTHSLALQIIKNRKKSISHIGHSVRPADWDADKQRVRKSHPNSARLNIFLMATLAEASGKILEAESEKEHVSAQDLRDSISGEETARTQADMPPPALFFVQAQNYLDELKAAGNYNQYTAEKPRISHFKEFAKNDNLTFLEISPGMLTRFQAFLKTYHIGKFSKAKKIPKKPVKERTIMNHLSTIRSVFAYARRNRLVTKEQSPFHGEDGTKINFPGTSKAGISPEDVAKLERLRLADETHEHARKLWLFSFYFAGMRVSDVFRLKWSDFQNYRLHYTMGKNEKEGSLKIPDKAAAILNYYERFKENEDDLVFPELKGVDLTDEFITKRTIAFRTSAIDKLLRTYVAPAAEITAKLTMHIARHTFADIAGDAVPVQMLQKLYRHSDIKTTIGYQANFIHKEADEALDAVLSKTNANKPSPR